MTLSAAKLDNLYMPEPNSGCWLWLGSASKPYGETEIGGVRRQAHRFVYELLRGPIPENADLDHLCRVPICVNPNHLEPVTHRENVLRGVGVAAINARKTHCLNGHEFTPSNISWTVDGRHCRTCKNARSNKYYERDKGKPKTQKHP